MREDGMPTRRETFQVMAGAVAAVGAGAMSEARAQGAAQQIKPAADDVFIVVDVQVDFLPGGALAVKDGDQVIAPINALAKRFAHVVLTQDWHTPGHVSFASTHAGKKPFEATKLAYGDQVLWPDHCVQGTRGAMISDELKIPHAELVIRKGYNRDIDSYSAFKEADRKTRTGLEGYLKERGFRRAFVAGLATDFCVAWTALDARAAGFDTYVIEDASRGIDTMGSLAAAWRNMGQAGVRRITSAAIA
ncbi:MAG TPA: bifunctional nicotinamidase/pyrazinamidase [Beijerinckiaceae bacterium]